MTFAEKLKYSKQVGMSQELLAEKSVYPDK